MPRATYYIVLTSDVLDDVVLDDVVLDDSLVLDDSKSLLLCAVCCADLLRGTFTSGGHIPVDATCVSFLITSSITSSIT